MIFLALAPAAWGAFPGENGKIAFMRGSFDLAGEIYAIDADGSDEVNLTSSPAVDTYPAWSPDGRKVAFASDRAAGDDDIWVMDADGSNATRLTTDPEDDLYPAWSPDGTKIAFTSYRSGSSGPLWVMNADGTGQTMLAPGPRWEASWSPDGTKIATTCLSMLCIVDAATGATTPLDVGEIDIRSPDWSPDGTRIAFSTDSWNEEEGEPCFCPNIRVVDADGSGEVQHAFGLGPAWSPAGDRIAFTAPDSRIYTMNPDVPGQVKLTANVTRGEYTPDWQPVVRKEFPRPKGATPLRASLVVAFEQCTSPNRIHGPPLDSPSCGSPPGGQPPTPASPNVTVGSPDWNGATANFTGHVRLDALLGNPATPADEADVAITVQTSDIRCYRFTPIAPCGADNTGSGEGGSGRDYTGQLQGSIALRLTDEFNSPFPDPATGAGPGTVQDTILSFTVPCAETASALNVGSTCSLATTGDAVVPGLVREKDRANWQLGQIRLLDGGPDGDAETASGNEPFLVQGLLVP